MKPVPLPVTPGRESVWAFPRPAIAKATCAHIVIVHQGVVLADTRASVRTLETSHPPSYYIPRADIDPAVLRPSARRSMCEWKGAANYFDVVIGDTVSRDVAWSYSSPTPAFAAIAGHLAFYAAPFDTVLVDGERVVPQPGGFYGGWITSAVAGPFKGIPGSTFW